jgi:hypothetical protein
VSSPRLLPAAPRRTSGPLRRADPARHVRHEPLRRLLALEWPTLLSAGLVLLGLQVRLLQWAGGRSLWLDEALLARSLVERSSAELATEPLLHKQAAPVLWLLASRFWVEQLGPTERALRVVPLLSGCLALLLLWRLATRLLSRWLVPVAVGLAALHPGLVYYSTEVKPYATDVAAVLVVLLVAQTQRPLLLGLTGAVAVWVSFPTVFLLAGTSLVLVLRSRQLRTALLLAPWVVSLAVAYLLVLRPLRNVDVLAQFWGYSFPRSPGDLPAWSVRRAVDLVDRPLELALAPLALALLAVGAVRLLRRHRTRAALTLAGVPLAVVAAALCAYPLADRLALWLVPLAIVLLAAVLPDRLEFPGRGGPLPLVLAAVALAAVAGPGLVRTLPSAVQVQRLEELKPVLQELSRRLQPDDVVLVDIAAKAAFDYYAPRLGVPRDGVVLFRDGPEAGSCDDRPALAAAGMARQRVWLVFSHRLTDEARLGGPADVLSRAGAVTLAADRISRPGADAVLLDPVAGSPLPRVPPTFDRCLVIHRSAR